MCSEGYENDILLLRECVFIPDKGGGEDVNKYGSQLVGLNLIIYVTVWVESQQLRLTHWRVIGCYL